MVVRCLSVILSLAIATSCASRYGGSGTDSPPVEEEAQSAETAPQGETPAAAAQADTTPADTAPAAKPQTTQSRAEKPVAADSKWSLASVFPRTPEDWPMWGGDPSRNMVVPGQKVVSSWDLTTGKNVKWQAQLGSQSYGNPVIAEGVILVGTNNQSERNPEIKGDKGIVMCFRETDGEFLWQAVHDKLEAGRVNDWPEQGVCSSPVVENGRAYYVSNRAEIVCADMKGFTDGENDGPFTEEKYTSKIDGDFIWVYDMIEELGVFPHNLATCSPMIVGDLVYVVTANGVERDHRTIPSPRSPSFLAVNKNTGEVVWESAEPGENILHGQWSAPAYTFSGGRAQVIFPGGDGWVRSFDPLEGEIIWEFDCNPKDSVWELGGLGTRNNLVSTPVCVGDRVYIGVGQDPEHGEGIGHLYAIDATKTGDVTESGRVWHYGDKDFRRTISTCAVYEDMVFITDLSGFLHCLDAKTGKPYWVHDTLAAVWGSPVVIDGKVFLGDEDGDVVVLEASKELKVIFETNMENSVYTTPVATRNVLYIVTRKTLYALAES